MNLKQLRTSFSKAVKTVAFEKRYALFSVGVLLATSLYWSLASARLQLGNADQLVNSYLFADTSTFHGAELPGAHSFLVKWPIFWVVKLFGYSGTTFTVFTVIVTLITVFGLAALLYRIERRRIVFGTLCLALASVLLLVPAQPYAGGILPVNMAMLATRNLEYLLYIVSLIMLVHKKPSLRMRRSWVGIGLLAVLIASDKLFLTLSLGGSIVTLLLYAMRRRWAVVTLATRWVVGSSIAGMAAIIGLWLIQALGLVHIADQSNAGPYGLVTGAHDLALGAIYSLAGLLTNFGANPAFDATVLRHIPTALQHRLLGISGVGFIVNLLILLAGLFAVWRLIKFTLGFKNTKVVTAMDEPAYLSIMLVWTAVTAFGLFVITNHYYAVDARYLTISLFAVFIALATYSRRYKFKPERAVVAGVIITLGIASGIFSAALTYHDQSSALSDVNQRNEVIGQVLQKHPVKLLVGDYWRVIPTKLAAGYPLNIMPLSGCTQPRLDLSSQAWQPDLHHHSFAYLLSFDRSLTDFPHCSFSEVIKKYGRPNASTVIAGNLTQPKEILLFYDQGAHQSSPSTGPLPTQSATITPISPEELPYSFCNVPTIMNVVAHQDDDLLFMNPDLIHDIDDGHCIRTIYVTAGDAGRGSFYWLGRERGSEAAYSGMLGLKNAVWIERIVKLGNHQFATVANPKGDTKHSVIFLHLPDGSPKGEGFATSNFESLAKLDSGRIDNIHAVDGQSEYTARQLESALTTFMHIYQPAEIRTQSNYDQGAFPDHSDHMAVGRFVNRAYSKYESQQFEGRLMVPIRYYIGYPVHNFPANISDGDLTRKEAAFFNYARFDGSVCATAEQCFHNPAYGSYLTREYQNPN